MRRNWYDIKAAAGNEPAVVTIYDEIGMWGITAKQFIESFRQIASDSVMLEINSPGGSVFDALAIFNAIKTSGKDVTVKVMGIAASAASYIAMVGNKITMPDNTFMMIHNPLNAIYGNAADMREMADILDKIGASLTSTYVARTCKPQAEVEALLAAESYLTAAECLALGLCDEVTPAITATAKFEREHLPENIRALFEANQPKADVDPEPAAEPVSPTDQQPVTPFADQVLAIATEAGVPQYAPILALDPTLTTADAVTARIAQVREISALCAVAKQPAAADGYVRARKTVDEVRALLLETLAVQDASSHTDTTGQSDGKPLAKPAAKAVKPASIWADRKAKSIK